MARLHTDSAQTTGGTQGSRKAGWTFVSCMAANIFRREAISNAHYKRTGHLSRGVAKTLAEITPVDLLAVAAEMEGSASAGNAIANRPAVRQLIKLMTPL